MRARLNGAQTGAMDRTNSVLLALSLSVTDLVERAVTGVVAVKGGAYRSASGVSVGKEIVAVADPTLRREERVPVSAADGTQGSGTLLGRDSRIHLAFLKVEGIDLKPLPPSDAKLWKAGMLAAVVGLTTDAGPSASMGILGAVSGQRRTWRGGLLEHFIRLDANVFPSQAGAAVVDCEARLIGMATPGLLQYSTVALPFKTLHRLADELLEQGRIRQGYLGVGLQRVLIRGARPEQTGSEQEFGLIILSVESGSPAEQAGLQLGDVLLSLDNKPLSDMDLLQDALSGKNVGREVEIVISRGGEKLVRKITVAEREKRRR